MTTIDRAQLQADLKALVAQHMEAESKLAAAIEGMRAEGEPVAEGLIALRDLAVQEQIAARVLAGTTKPRLAREFGVGIPTIYRKLNAATR